MNEGDKMESTMTDVLAFATVIAVIVSMAMETIKRTLGSRFKKNWIPAVSFFVGLVIGAISYPFTDMELIMRLWAGGISGWMASGIYETIKQTKKL
jgi:hypothetical protein